MAIYSNLIGNIEGLQEQEAIIEDFEDLFRDMFLDDKVLLPERFDKFQQGKEFEYEKAFILKRKYNNERIKALFAIDKSIYRKDTSYRNISNYRERIFYAYYAILKESIDDTEKRSGDKILQFKNASKSERSNMVGNECRKFFENFQIVDGIRMKGLESKLYHSDNIIQNGDILFLNEMEVNNEKLNSPFNNFIHFTPIGNFERGSIFNLFQGVVHKPSVISSHKKPLRYVNFLKERGIDIKKRKVVNTSSNLNMFLGEILFAFIKNDFSKFTKVKYIFFEVDSYSGKLNIKVPIREVVIETTNSLKILHFLFDKAMIIEGIGSFVVRKRKSGKKNVSSRSAYEYMKDQVYAMRLENIPVAAYSVRQRDDQTQLVESLMFVFDNFRSHFKCEGLKVNASIIEAVNN